MSDRFDITGKIAVVTGGARGLGRGMTTALIEAGAKVYVTSRDEKAGAETAGQFTPEQCVSLPCDVTDMASIDALVAELTRRETRIDILVNNSGVSWSSDLPDYSEDGWDSVLDTNLKAPFFVTKKLLPLLRAAGTPEDPARVINLGSIAGSVGYDNNGFAYMSSKAGLNHLTRALAVRLARENVNVNAIAPGPMAAGMLARIETDPALKERLEAGIPYRRAGTPEDLAGALIFLCARASSYITGAILPVDGGASVYHR